LKIGGTYPMLYAFFGCAGELLREAFARQVEAAIASDAAWARRFAAELGPLPA
jgi:hypothetical protein